MTRMTRMNPEIKQKWITALRSGGYLQGKGGLRIKGWPISKTEKFCCLGVLCEIAVKAGVIPAPVNDASLSFYKYGGEQIASTLPAEVIAWAGLPSGNPILPKRAHRTLAEMNDSGVSFSEIADIIEENL